MNLHGWVPIRVKWQGNEAFVDWCWLGSDRFSDPFFDGTIEISCRKPFNALFTHRSPIAELDAWHMASPGMAPAGFIFHMSRCGSTLASQTLAALPESVVVSEAAPIDWLARRSSLPYPTAAQWLRSMVSALGQKRSGCETRYFIKFDSVTVTALPFIRRVFPDVPWIFLYRNPEEVLVSQLREPAAAMSPGIVTDAPVLDLPMNEILSMSPEEYAARVLGRLCELAALAMDDHGMLISYTQLPEALWGRIARHFNMKFSPEDLRRMQEVILRNAKRPGLPYVPDGESKLREVSDSVREASARWIMPHYQKLEQIRLRTGE